MATQPSVEQEQVRHLPLALVVPSKSNPRKTFDVAELAEDIRRHGVISPVLTRPKNGKFEIVYGERRLRASKEAGSNTIPAIVKELSDEEADELRFVENLQREGLSPMEEAQGLGHKYANVPTADIAAKIGKPEAWVVQRLRLLKLIAKAQTAFAEGKILLGHALELCKLREAEQENVLSWLLSARVDIRQNRQWQEVKTHHSVEALKRYIQANYFLILSKAPFDTTDPSLNPKMGACTTCSYNTANQVALFPDAKGARCTVPDCFAIKTQGAIELTLAKIAEETGKPAFRLAVGWEGNNQRIKADGYLNSSHNCAIREVPKGQECESAQQAIVVYVDENVNANTDAKLGQRVVICADLKCPKHHRSGSAGAKAPLKGVLLIDHKEDLLKKTLGQRVREEVFSQLVAKWLDSGSARAFLPKVKTSTFAALLHYVRMHLYIDRFRDAGKALGLERPEKKSGQGANWEGTVVDYFGKNESALVLALVAAEGLQDADKENPLYRMAAEYRVNVAKITEAIGSDDKQSIKEMRAKAKENAKTKAPKKAAKKVN